MKQQLLNQLNSIEGDIVYINCTNMGSVPHIVRGPRYNVPLLKRQVASLITMGFKIEILSPIKEELAIKQEIKEVLVEENKVIEVVQEIKLEIVEPKVTQEVLIEEKKEDETVEEASVENSLEGMSKTKLKKLLKEHDIEFENSDSIEVLREKASAII